MSADDWRHQAACRDEDPEIFHPVGTTGPALAQAEKAKAVCRRCPAIQLCLQWALDTDQDQGVWGGLDQDERRHPGHRTPGRKPATPLSPTPAGRPTVAACGTPAGSDRHYRLREKPCKACRQAKNAVNNARRQARRTATTAA